MKFFFNIHTAVDNANEHNLTGLDRVKDEVESYHEATEPGARLERSRPMNGNRAKLSKFVSTLSMKSFAAFELRSSRYR